MKTTKTNGSRVALALLTALVLLTGCVVIPVGGHHGGGVGVPVPIIPVPVPVFVPIGHHGHYR